jgi:hypothetical protein
MASRAGTSLFPQVLSPLFLMSALAGNDSTTKPRTVYPAYLADAAIAISIHGAGIPDGS